MPGLLRTAAVVSTRPLLHGRHGGSLKQLEALGFEGAGQGGRPAEPKPGSYSSRSAKCSASNAYLPVCFTMPAQRLFGVSRKLWQRFQSC